MLLLDFKVSCTIGRPWILAGENPSLQEIRTRTDGGRSKTAGEELLAPGARRSAPPSATEVSGQLGSLWLLERLYV